eukprot:jgi/Bigna1/129400/aug1.9_g4108
MTDRRTSGGSSERLVCSYVHDDNSNNDSIKIVDITLIDIACDGVEKGDRVLEIGCDVGLTTAALASRAGDKLSIEMARERYPSLRFVQEDINLDGTGLRKMAAKLFAHQSLVSPEQKGRPEQGKGLLSKESIIFDKIFIDINGMRSLKDVRQLLISVMRELKPRLINAVIVTECANYLPCTFTTTATFTFLGSEERTSL